jgi:hypothetical protein
LAGLTGKCPASPALSACGRQAGGVKGHDQNDISFARFPLATTCPGSPGLWPGASLYEKKELNVYHKESKYVEEKFRTIFQMTITPSCMMVEIC